MSSQQVEVEAAKFLHKLIQESKDEPAKLATKLFVICQHMKMSGKEHSLPYQVISRAMKTVIDQHGLDINALKTSRLPPVGGLGEPSNRLKTCDRPESGGGSNFLVKDSSTGGYASSSSHRVEGASGASEIGKHDAAASDRPPVRPTRIDNVGQDNPQELISLTSCKSSDHGSPTTLPMEDSRSTNSQEDKDTKSNKQVARKITKRAPAKRKRADTRSIAESHNDDLQMTDVASSGFNASKEKLPSKGDTQAPTDRSDNLVLQTVRHEQMPSFAGTSQENFQPFFERSLDKTNPNPLPPGSNIFGSTGVWVQNKFGKQLEARECSSSSGIVSSAANPPKIVMGQGGDNLETPAFSYQVTQCVQDNAATSGRRGLIDPRNQHYFTRPTSELKFTGNYGDAKNIVEMPNIPKDMGKSSNPHAAMLSNMPFKEQHLKQLRAQCLVFLAFRNNLVPRKLHLEIALGESYPQEGPGNGVKEAYQEEHPSSSENPSLGNMSVDMREAVKGMHAQNPPCSLSTGNVTQAGSSFNNPENTNRYSLPDRPTAAEGWKHALNFNKKLEGSQEKSPCDQGAWLNPSSSSVAPGNPLKSESPVFMRTGLGCDIQNNKPPVAFLQVQNESTQGSTEVNDSIPANTCKGKEFEMVKCSTIPDRNINSGVPHSCQIEMLSSASSPTMSRVLSGTGNGNPRDNGAVDAQQLPGSEGFKTIIFGDTGNNEIGDTRLDKPSVQEEGNKPEPQCIPLSPPKYGTTEKWILIQQKKKFLTEKNWIAKQRKADERITKCFTQLKESVNSSEDISAKTKSVIELKKLQLLKLQCRLRSEFLNDFFKPITSDMERMKSVKKNKHGRRVKQLEKYELKMKEERMKRVRERQKEFFGELEVHREGLEECFKVKRERWRSFNRHVKEFHKRKERIHREKIDRIQREKINLLKNNDVEGYLRMVQDAKSDRVKQLLKETEKYLQKLGSKLQEAKATARRFEMEMDENRANMIEKNEIFINDEDGSDEAQHYLESNEKYYKMAHSVKESIEEQPASLQGGKLRKYQMNGLRWLVSLYNNNLNGILADEMGLGKTVQVISLICYLMEIKNDRGPFLVVVPSSVLPGWETEINFWAPSIIKIAYAGPPEERRRLFKDMIIHQKFNVLLTTYEYLMNKHDRPKLSKIHWHYIIIDEGHRIKNASCKLNADLKQYQSSHRLLLTGTPLQNNLEELWALLNFLLPSMFNSAEDFSQWFNKPFEGSGDNSPDEALLSEEENLLIINRLHQVLRPFVLRRLKHKVENELPEKIERLIRCEASAYQKLLMKRVAENLGSVGNTKIRSVHNTVMELRNICNHPYLSQLHAEEVNDLIPKHYLPPILRLCGKLEMLDRLLPKLKATNHRVLFFSTMTRLLDVMEDYLYWKRYRYLRLDGHTSGNDRGALIEEFNRPDSPAFIFLLSIRAGGVGVNLQAADTVIIFDTDWNPQVDLQAQARAHRIGQKKDVLVLRLETVDSVEEQVRASAEHKLGVANQSITAGFFDNNTSAEDRREYLESLLREHKKEETAHVLDDDALNDILARSEPEIDIFEAVDTQRREEEMATWQKLVQERVTGGRELVPLPSRLVTDEDLKPLYQAMHISESAAGVKRKGEYTGGLDSQNYGRGKRAREVRSYEDQWTEEEFEKLCQADSPESPKTQDSGKDLCHVKETYGSRNDVEITKSSEEPEKLPIITESAPKQSLLQSVLPQLPVKDNPSPAKRGRGRPKRVISDAIPVPPGSTSSITLKVEEVGTLKERLPLLSMTADASDKVKGDVVNLQKDVCEETTIGSLPSSTPVIPTVAKSRARKPKSGDRGKKQASGSFSLAQVGIEVASTEGAVVVKNKYHGRTRAHKNAYSLHAHSSSETVSVPTALQEDLKPSATDKNQIVFEALGSDIGAARVISSSNSEHLALEQPKRQQEAMEASILETGPLVPSTFELNSGARGSAELNFSKSIEKDIPVEQSAQSPQLMQKVMPTVVSQLTQKSLEVITSEDASTSNSMLHTTSSSITQEKSLVPASTDPTHSLPPTDNTGLPVIVRRTSEKKTSVTSKKAAARETKRTRASYSAVYADSQMMGVRESNGKQIDAKSSDLNSGTQMMDKHMKHVDDITGQILLSEEGNASILAFGSSCKQSENLNDKLEFHSLVAAQRGAFTTGESGFIFQAKTSDSIEAKEVEQLKDSIVDANVVNIPSSSTESEKPKCLMDEALDYSSKLSQLTQASDIAKLALSAQVIFGEQGTAEASSSHSLVKSVVPDSIEGKEVEQLQDSIMDANVVNLPSSSTESEKPKCVMDGALVNYSKVSQLTQASDIAKQVLSTQIIFGERGIAEASLSHSLVKSVVSPDSIEGKEIEQLKDSIVDAKVVDLLSSSTESEKPECVMDEALDNSSKLSQLTQASDISKTALSTQIIFGEHGIAEASLSHSLVKFVVPTDSIEGKEVKQFKDCNMDANVINIPSSSTESEKRKCLMDEALDYSSKLSQLTQASDIAKLALSAQVIYDGHENSIEGKEVEQLQDSIMDANVVNLPSSSTESEKPECVMDGALGNSLKVSQLTQVSDIAKQALSAQVIFGEDGTEEASSSHSLVKSVAPDSIEGKEVEQLKDSIMDANVVNIPSSSTESEKLKCFMDEALDYSLKVSQLTQVSDIAKQALSAQVIFGEDGTAEASSSHSLVKSVVPPDSIERKEVEQMKDSIIDANVVNIPSSSHESEKLKCLMDKAVDYSSKLSQLTQASDIAQPTLSAQVIFGEHGAVEASLSHSLVKSVLPSDDALNCGACDERSSSRILPTKIFGALLDDVDTRLTTCDVTQDELCETVCIDVPPPKAINLRGSNSESISNVIISSNDKLKISAEDPAVGSDVTEVPQLHVSSYANDNEKSKVVIGASSTCGTLSVMPTVSVIFDGNGNDEIVNGQLSSLSGNLKDSSQSMINEGELPCGEISLEQDLAVPPISGSFDLPNKKFVTAEHDTGITISGKISSAATETISHCMPNVNSFTPKATPLFLLTETCSTHGTGGTDETVQEVKSVILDVVVVKSDYPVSHFDDNMDSSLQLLDACQEKVSAVEEEKVTDSFANILNAIRDASLPDVSNLNEGHEKAVVSFPSVDSVDAVADNMHVDASSTYVSENPGDGLAREEEVHLGEPTVLTSLPEVSLGIAASTLSPEMIEDEVKCIESPCGINRFAAEEEKIPPHSANTTMQPQSPSHVCKDSSVDLDDSSVDVNSEMRFSASLKPDNSYFSSETDASSIAVSNVSHLSEQTKIYEGHCEFAEVSDIQQTGDQRLAKEDSGLIFVDHINCPIGTSSESQNQKISTAAMGDVSLCAFTVAIDLSVCVLPDKRDSTSQANTTDLLLPVIEKDDRELVQIKYENEKSLSDNITVKDYSELDSSSLLTVGATGCDFVGATDCDLPDKRDSTSQANTTDILLPVLAKDDRELVELKYEKEKSLPENITEGDSSELDSPSLPAVGSTVCDSPGRGNSNSLAEMLKPLSPDLTRDNEMNKLACEMKASFLKVDEMYVTDGTAVVADETHTSTLFLSECLIENANESPLVADAPLDPKDSLVDILSVTPEPNYAIPGCALVVAKSSLHSENTCHLSEREVCRHETSLATDEVSKVHTNIFSGDQEKHCISTEDNPILHVAAAGVGSVDETSSEACDCSLGEQNISSITEMMTISQLQSQLAENKLDDDGKSDHITVSQISCPIFPSDADNSISETIYPANSPNNDSEINQKSGEGYLEPPQSFQERQVMESTEPADRTLPEESAEPVNMTQNPEVQEVNELRGLADIAHQSVKVQELKESVESAAVASQPSHTQENDGI